MKPEKRLQKEIIDRFIEAMETSNMGRMQLEEMLDDYHKEWQSFSQPIMFRKQDIAGLTKGFNLNLTLLELATLKIIYDDALYAIYDHNTMEESARSVLAKINDALNHGKETFDSTKHAEYSNG